MEKELIKKIHAQAHEAGHAAGHAEVKIGRVATRVLDLVSAYRRTTVWASRKAP